MLDYVLGVFVFIGVVRVSNDGIDAFCGSAIGDGSYGGCDGGIYVLQKFQNFSIYPIYFLRNISHF